ncbi:hypothetical protein MNBD_CHLOROFLEXI01-1435 [hydrothermal vent metagenome]|uniref:Uncharacterized protein n=1 Tax=hydrothermal vent metagenome TaxID=652676 RepID=A0A3B0VRR2_9ZZZZ
MSRIIHVNSPTKIRNRNRRSIAEMLRKLMQKPEIDAEAKDMAAMITLLLWEIADGVEQSAQAWEKRDYWMKAERFMRDWEWSPKIGADLEDVIRNEAWDLVPELMADLYPHFGDIQIKSMTRKATLWQGAHKKLLSEPPREYSW